MKKRIIFIAVLVLCFMPTLALAFENPALVDEAGYLTAEQAAEISDKLDKLRAEISRRIALLRHRVELMVPYNKGAVLSLIHSKGQVEKEEYTGEGTMVTCLLDSALYQRVLKQLED